jgi:hypothetical protein
MNENPSPAPAGVRFTISAAVACLSVLLILLVKVGLMTLGPHSSFRFRFLPWFSLAALALVVGWGLITRRWWAPVALLVWDLAAVSSMLFSLIAGDL